MSSVSKQQLTAKLGDLLGSTDGADDILEHLLTISSPKDLLDYLSQLLGGTGELVTSFVDEVSRFKAAEGRWGIKLRAPPTSDEKDSSKSPASTSQSTEPANNDRQGSRTSPKRRQRSPKGKKTSAIDELISSRRKRSPVPKKSQQKLTVISPQRKKREEEESVPPDSEKDPPLAEKPNEASAQNDASSSRRSKSHPQKGKAKVDCGCFGTKHKALTNCLYCGRILCEREGYGSFCPCCGMLVEEPPKAPSTAEGQEAWRHKERLLSFDRDFARRTVVLDDQADYFTDQSSAWLEEDEREDAATKESARNRNMHTRQKQTLNIVF